MNENEIIAPVYRYFTTDLVTNEILMEIPFQGVSYERGLRGAGAFTGQIPVIDNTKHLDIYETTMPGQTGLYVVRNGVCVWGGIIWSRSMDVKSKTLTVDGSEFTSYFHHRLIWHTTSNVYEATFRVYQGATPSSAGKIQLSHDSMVEPPENKARVHVEFSEPENYIYNGYYIVSGGRDTNGMKNGTYTSFSLGVSKGASIVGFGRQDNIATVETATPHQMAPGYLVGMRFGYYDSVSNVSGSVAENGEVLSVLSPTILTIKSPGSNMTFDSKTRTYSDTLNSGVPLYHAVPTGIDYNVTVSLDTDPYSYVKNLISTVSRDFVGFDFANDYLTPGISYEFDIVSTRILEGYATITTNGPHDLTLGQGITIRDLGPLYDGEHVVSDIPSPNEFRFESGGLDPVSSVQPRAVNIIGRSSANYMATIYTDNPHGYRVGERVNISPGTDVDGNATIFTGQFVITGIPTPTSFVYRILSPIATETVTLTDAIVSKSGTSRKVVAVSSGTNSTTYYLDSSAGTNFSVGDSVSVSGLDITQSIVEKSLDAALSRATITTLSRGYRPSTGSTVEITGVVDAVNIKDRDISSEVWVSTSPAHNFTAGDVVTIDGAIDSRRVTSFSVTGQVGKLYGIGSTYAVGKEVLISNLSTTSDVTSRVIKDSEAIFSTSAHHGYRVNDSVTFSNMPEISMSPSVEVDDGLVILTTSTPHAFLEGMEITISNSGMQILSGTHTIVATTSTRVIFRAKNSSGDDLYGVNVPPRRTNSSCFIRSADSSFNTSFVVSRVESLTSFVVRTALPDSPLVTFSSFTKVSGPAPVNGRYTITSRDSTMFWVDISYPLSGLSFINKQIDIPVDEDVPQPRVDSLSVLNGSYPVLKATRDRVYLAVPEANKPTYTESLSYLGVLSGRSIFSGTQLVTGTGVQGKNNTFVFNKTAPSNVLETATSSSSFVRDRFIVNGAGTISSIRDNTITVARPTLGDVSFRNYAGRGRAVVRPVVESSSYGPYPRNSDIGITLPSESFMSQWRPPTPYRGFQLTNLGSALEEYSDGVDGFEYRIDCKYSPDTDSFSRFFRFIPINFPNPPAPGEASPPSRFGADKLVFEYPGNIADLKIEESAENSATRFFVVGDANLGGESANPYSAASATDLLDGRNMRRWPILDASESVSDIDDEIVLYAYSKKYLSESRPPDAKLTVQLNGSLQPEVGSYAPGDWCSLIVDDDFLRMRLASSLEPRDTVLVRKIDSYRVNVPDSITFPETVELNLVSEREVDKIG